MKKKEKGLEVKKEKLNSDNTQAIFGLELVQVWG